MAFQGDSRCFEQRYQCDHMIGTTTFTGVGREVDCTMLRQRYKCLSRSTEVLSEIQHTIVLCINYVHVPCCAEVYFAVWLGSAWGKYPPMLGHFEQLTACLGLTAALRIFPFPLASLHSRIKIPSPLLSLSYL